MNLLDTLPFEVILDISEYLDTDDYLSLASMYRINPVCEICQRLKNEKWAKVTYPVEGNKIDGDKNKKYWHEEIITIHLRYQNAYVCIVDDNPMTRKIMKKMIGKLTDEYVLLSGTMLLFDVLTYNYDDVTFIFTDLQLMEEELSRCVSDILTYKEEGLCLINWIREFEKTNMVEDGIKIVAFSSDASLKHKALAVGADMFYSKPITKQILMDILKKPES
ncbi:hypothetical protein DFS34DRAFT_686283 [Phlyctochytrium arcticum]|nr:hypothetical protein DFS34DRAFT_686283 [Phlyctochytrium arcticum]